MRLANLDCCIEKKTLIHVAHIHIDIANIKYTSGSHWPIIACNALPCPLKITYKEEVLHLWVH